MMFVKLTTNVGPLCISYVQGRRLSMVILLPNKLDGLDTLGRRLASSGLLQSLDSRMRTIRLDVVIPKFELSSSFQLVEALKSMGVKNLFDHNVANLASISGTKGMYVSNAFHRSSIRVDEKGAMAAASTGTPYLHEG